MIERRREERQGHKVVRGRSAMTEGQESSLEGHKSQAERQKSALHLYGEGSRLRQTQNVVKGQVPG